MYIEKNDDSSYDTLNPVEELARFNAFLRNVIKRYEGNEVEKQQLEWKISDILHYVEFTDNLSASKGFKIYQKLREIRNERRKLKKENELLFPLYEFAKTNRKIENDLNQLLGKCRAAKNLIDNRRYATKTDVLEDDELE